MPRIMDERDEVMATFDRMVRLIATVSVTLNTRQLLQLEEFLNRARDAETKYSEDWEYLTIMIKLVQATYVNNESQS